MFFSSNCFPKQWMDCFITSPKWGPSPSSSYSLNPFGTKQGQTFPPIPLLFNPNPSTFSKTHLKPTQHTKSPRNHAKSQTHHQQRPSQYQTQVVIPPTHHFSSSKNQTPTNQTSETPKKTLELPRNPTYKKRKLEVNEPAGEGGPDEVVVGQPVVEHRNERLPLGIPLVHRNRRLAGCARLLHLSLSLSLCWFCLTVTALLQFPLRAPSGFYAATKS